MTGKMAKVRDDVLRFGAYSNNVNALTLSNPIDTNLATKGWAEGKEVPLWDDRSLILL